MSRLVPLADIPYAARAAERSARRRHATRAPALEAAAFKIVLAPGCHGRPHFDPPVIGWVLTRAAGVALSEVLTRMPDGTAHRRLTYEEARVHI